MTKPKTAPECDYLSKVSVRLITEAKRERFDALLEQQHYLHSARLGAKPALAAPTVPLKLGLLLSRATESESNHSIVHCVAEVAHCFGSNAPMPRKLRVEFPGALYHVMRICDMTRRVG